MSETNEQKQREASVEVKTGAGGTTTETRVAEERVVTTATTTTRGPNRTVIVATVAVVAIAGLAFLFWWLSRSEGGGAGRPVPAPRTVAIDQPGAGGASGGAGGAPTEATLRLTPEAVATARIRVEPVGEQLAFEIGGSGAAATGVVQPNAYRSTPVVSLVGGILGSVGAELGEEVRRGQTLAVVTSNDLAATQSRYLTAMAELDEQQRRHRRTARLVEIGAASREEFEQATTRLRTAESEVAAGRQRLLLLGLTPQRVSALRSSSQISSEVSLTAPVSGTVISRAANAGEVIEANREILRVADLSTVWIIGQVYERDLARIRPGSGASVTTEAHPGRVFRGRISYIDPSLDPQTRTGQVRIELANPGQMLRIGMYVQIAFGAMGDAERTSPVIPVAAVQNINNQQIVFVATDDPNVFVLRPVRLGAEANGRVPVLEGLAVGERIVTEGSFLLRAEWLKYHPGGNLP
jgi:membrane fusion protein, heavy metal efflux system